MPGVRLAPRPVRHNVHIGTTSSGSPLEEATAEQENPVAVADGDAEAGQGIEQ